MNNLFKDNLSTVQIETTNSCNYRCLMCAYTENPPLKKHDLSLKDFKKLLKQLKRTKIRTFVGHNLGEPLLTPNYIDMLEYFDAQFRGKLFTFNSNGSKLDRAFWQRLLKLKNNRFQINLSLDAATSKAYRALHGRAFPVIKKRVKAFLEDLIKTQNKKIEVVLNFIVTPTNYTEQKKFITQWKPFLKQSKKIKIKFNPLAWNQLLKKRFNYEIWTRAHPDAAIFRMNKPRKRSCLKPWHMLSIQANGDVGLCCYSSHPSLKIGNFFEQPIKKILANKKIKGLRRDFKGKDFKQYPVCYFCHA